MLLLTTTRQHNSLEPRTMPDHWLSYTPHALIEDLISKSRLTTASLGAELHIKIILVDQNHITVLRMPKQTPEGSPNWLILDYTSERTDPTYNNSSIGRIVLNALQTPLRASFSPGTIQIVNLAFEDADIEPEIGGRRLHLAVLVRGMQDHISPLNWPPFDDYKPEPLEYLLSHTSNAVSRQFYQSVIDRARRYQNPDFTRSMTPAEIRKLFARMLALEIAVGHHFIPSHDVGQAAVLLQLRHLDHVPRQSAPHSGLYVWPVSKEELRGMKIRKVTEVSAAPRIYDVVGWLDNDKTLPRVDLHHDFVPDVCVFRDYRLDQMAIHRFEWRSGYWCNEQGVEIKLERFWLVNWSQ
ncbi:hypothetical protein AC578_8182 [Pseudocercospora eumusae]|uniref:Uncharacterized protein n=1 Tax=Pseudocercospora eumusae TaxID=321146 RepID=A0A139HEV0_9PEZI|nr:hypothetical protein AC578_8182 [Pseudocercospora eumusae]